MCHPSLYKLDRITHEENLCALLVENPTCQKAASSPKNSDAEVTIILLLSPNIPSEETADDIELENYHLTLMTELSCNAWYITSSESKNENGIFKMEHLTRVQHVRNSCKLRYSL